MGIQETPIISSYRVISLYNPEFLMCINFTHLSKGILRIYIQTVVSVAEM